MTSENIENGAEKFSELEWVCNKLKFSEAGNSVHVNSNSAVKKGIKYRLPSKYLAETLFWNTP